jgi:hypothetical protein
MMFWKKKGLKVCILAMPKSGSTALFQAIRTRMSGEVLEGFEPKTLDEVRGYKREQQVLTKVLPIGRDDAGNWEEGFRYFDHRIVLVRDPRDLILSRIFFRPQVAEGKLWNNDDKLDGLIRRLKLKIEVPEAHNMFGDVLDDLSANHHAKIAFYYQKLQAQIRDGGRLITYDDVVSGNLDSLWQDLRLPREPLKSDNRWNHVPRTKASDNWRRWFTEADVAALRPIVDPVLQMFDGLDPNWDLAKSPQLTPAESIDYIVKTVNMTRRRLNFPEYRPNP